MAVSSNPATPSCTLPSLSPIRVGMLGFGTVGQGVWHMLADNREAIERKVGCPIEVVRIGVRDAAKPRSAPAEVLTVDLESIVDDPDIDVILELMGGVDPAGVLIERALGLGKHVVTANKELIAKRGSHLVRLAADHGLDLHFEAAVGGGIPLIQPLKHQLAGNDVLKLMGILNGTTNYILTAMAEEGSELEEALGEAQSKGYAEADPTNDIDGFDAQYKLAILSSIVFNREVSPDAVYREGIRSIAKRDMQFAELLGFRIKLLGIVEPVGVDEVLARVHPTLVPRDHPLADVRGVYNAVWLQGDFVGDVMFSGRGAGGAPTGSAVVGDLIDVCRNIRFGGAGNVVPFEADLRAAPLDDLTTRYYLRLIVLDRPKTLGCIATIFGNCDVSLSAMEMRVLEGGRLGEIVFLTHPCRESQFKRAIQAIKNLHIVESVANWLRVES